MQQILATPEVQSDSRSLIATDGEPISLPIPTVKPGRPAPSAASRLAHTWLQVLMFIFSSSQPERDPECSHLSERQELPLDRTCRLDPYLYIRSTCG